MRTSVLIVALTTMQISPLAVAGEPHPSTAVRQPRDEEQEKLEQLVAPIALYPDDLLSQVLMASTYPLEITQAARFLAANERLSGDDLDRALKDQTWDPSVKSLCFVPDVLVMMNENLDWSQALGDAFLEDQNAVLATVQAMRRKALEAGTLKTTEQQLVTNEGGVITIESTDEDVVYVPEYYPTESYGSWYYPTWYWPPLYVPRPRGALVFAFAAGVAWGAARWGDCNWTRGRAHVDIDVFRHNVFVNHTEKLDRRAAVRVPAREKTWQHRPEHRKGVRYADARTAKRYAGGGASSRVSRDRARGFDRTGRSGAARTTGTSRPRTGTTDSSRRTATSRQRSSRTHGGGLSGSRNPSFDRAASRRGSYSRSGGSRRGGFSRGGGRGGRR